MKSLSVAIVLAAVLISLSNRYVVSTHGGTGVTMVDNLTGRTWFCSHVECLRVWPPR